MEDQVNYQLRVSPFLNIITDESTDISGNRIINTSMITTSGDCFYISNLEAKAGRLGAEELAEHTVAIAKQVTNGNLSKVSSITTDTCSTMRLLWKRLENQPDMKHIFTVPCDSHGLQLIFKDLLQQPVIKQYWTLASTIVNTLRNSAKQHSYLCMRSRRRSTKERGGPWLLQLLLDGGLNTICSSQSTIRRRLFVVLPFAMMPITT